jgi:hypothetical protein
VISTTSSFTETLTHRYRGARGRYSESRSFGCSRPAPKLPSKHQAWRATPKCLSVILAFEDWVGFTVDARDDDLQREILRLIPSQLAGLHMRLEEVKEREAKPKLKLPTVAGRIRHVPPLIGFIADIGGFVVVVLFVGRVASLW